MPFASVEIDGLKIIRELGRGGLGSVFLAQDRGLGRDVAVKVLRQEIIADQTSRERFLVEAKSLCTLDHNNIVGFIRYGIDRSNQPYLVMQYFPAQTLAAYISTSRTSEELIRIFIQLCEGLQAAHDANLVHRDIKPTNILVDEFGKAKLIDFGLCKLLPGGGQDLQRLTQEGFLVGTTFYMSPEQYLSQPVDQRSDIYSLGCVLYECIFGELPNRGGPDRNVIQARLPCEPAFQSKFGVAPTVELVALAQKAMQLRPENRFQSASEFCSALRKLDGAHNSLSDESAAPDDFMRILAINIAILVCTAILLFGAIAYSIRTFDVSGLRGTLRAQSRVLSEGRIASDLNQVQALLNEKNPQAALKIGENSIQSAQQLLPSPMKPCLVYRAFCLTAEAQFACGNHEDALRRIRQARELAKRAGISGWLMGSIARAGYFFQLQGDQESARLEFQRALQLAPKIGSKEEAKNALLSLAAYVDPKLHGVMSRDLYVRLFDDYRDWLSVDELSFVAGNVLAKSAKEGFADSQGIEKFRVALSTAGNLEKSGNLGAAKEQYEMALRLARQAVSEDRISKFIQFKIGLLNRNSGPTRSSGTGLQ